MPGVLIIEAMAQAAGLLGFKMMGVKPSDGTLYYFVGSDKLRFRQPVRPGDQLVLEADFLSNKRGIWKFDCRATVDGKPVCSAEIICAEQENMSLIDLAPSSILPLGWRMTSRWGPGRSSVRMSKSARVR